MRWSAREEEILAQMIRDGMTLPRIARILQRSPAAVLTRLEKIAMNLLEVYLASGAEPEEDSSYATLILDLAIEAEELSIGNLARGVHARKEKVIRVILKAFPAETN